MQKFILDEAKKKRKSRKKPYNSITYTTGDPAYNLKMFNKRMGGGMLSGSWETEANKAAEDAAKEVGTILSPSPDGGSSVNFDGNTASESAGGEGIGESLKIFEAKRYVRRYYIRPINKFCSTKTDIINYLIEYNDTDCTIYTLNNLIDNDDVTKLTSKDIIYYYEDGILYDKNHMKIMDYELAVKNEEEREHIDIEKASDSELKRVYADRLIGAEYMDEALKEDTHAQFAKPEGDRAAAYNNALKYANKYNKPFIYGYTNAAQKGKFFALEQPIKCTKDVKDCEKDFRDQYKNSSIIYVAYPEILENKKINEDNQDDFCVICGEPLEDYGNNAEPYAHGQCCDACNIKFVIPARLAQLEQEE